MEREPITLTITRIDFIGVDTLLTGVIIKGLRGRPLNCGDSLGGSGSAATGTTTWVSSSVG